MGEPILVVASIRTRMISPEALRPLPPAPKGM